MIIYEEGLKRLKLFELTLDHEYKMHNQSKSVIAVLGMPGMLQYYFNSATDDGDPQWMSQDSKQALFEFTAALKDSITQPREDLLLTFGQGLIVREALESSLSRSRTGLSMPRMFQYINSATEHVNPQWEQQDSKQALLEHPSMLNTLISWFLKSRPPRDVQSESVRG